MHAEGRLTDARFRAPYVQRGRTHHTHKITHTKKSTQKTQMGNA